MLSASDDINVLDFDEYVILDCMIKCREMEEADASVVVGQKAAYRERIQNMAPPKDAGKPSYIRDERATDDYVSFEERRRW